MYRSNDETREFARHRRRDQALVGVGSSGGYTFGGYADDPVNEFNFLHCQAVSIISRGSRASR